MVALAVTGLTAPARAETYTAGLFEDFQNGSIDGQQGWTNPGPEDVAIVTPASARNLGVHALRLSNAVAADQPTSHAFSPHLSEVAGESGAVHRHFDTSFLFTSADPSNVQTGLVVAVAPAGPDGRPISLIRIYDKPDGLDVTLTSADTAGQLHEESIAQGLVRSQLHSVSLSVDFAPGAANDFVSARVDDPNFPIVTRASWEEYYRQTAQSEPPKVDSLVFLPTLPIQPGLPAMPPQPGLSGRGLLIDQLPGTNAPPFVRTSGNVTPGQLGMCDVEFDSVEQSVNLSLDCQTPQPLTIPDNWTLDGSGHILFAESPTGGTFTGAIVKSGGATMGVRNITITAKDMVGRSGILDGIRFQNSGGSVQDVTVSNITHGTGADEGRAIVADNRGGVGRPTVTVEDADIVNYQKAGVVALGNVDLNLRNSAISSAGDLGVAADAVRLSDGATGEIVGNSIVGNEWNGTAAVAASAIAVSGDAIAEINRNLISGTGTDVGILVDGAAADVTCNLVQRTPGSAPDRYGYGLFSTNNAEVNQGANTFGSEWTVRVEGTTTHVNGDCPPAEPVDVQLAGDTIRWQVAEPPPAYAPVTYVVSLDGQDIHVGLEHELSIEGLEPGRTYQVVVHARIEDGVETASQPVSITTPPLPAAQNIHITGGAGTVGVSWAAPSPAPGLTRYDVTLLRNGQIVDGRVVQAGSPLTATFSGLLANVKYTVRIDTIAWTTATVSREIDTSAPSPPPGVTLTGGIGAAVVRWGASTSSPDWPVASYLIRAIGGSSVTVPGTTRAVTIRGLVPGRGYTFTVTARNAWGSSPASARALAPAALTSSLSPTLINYAQVATLRGALTSAGRAVPGVVLNVYARRPNVATYSLVARVRTSSTGAYIYSAKLGASTFYSVQFPGSATHVGVIAPTRGVSVRTIVSAALTRTVAPLRATVALRGTVVPNHARQSVALQRLVGRTWRAAGTARLASNSTYSFRIPTTARGSFTYRVVKPADADHAIGVSPSRTLRVT